MDVALEQAITRYLRMHDATKRSAAYHDLVDALAPHCKTPEDWQRAARLILERRAEWESCGVSSGRQ